MTCMAETSTLRRGYLSSKSLQCTGKSFGIINTTQAPSQVGDDSDVDDELDRMAAAAADDLSNDGLDAGVEAALDILLRVGCRNSLEEIVRQRECIQTTSGNICNRNFKVRLVGPQEATLSTLSDNEHVLQ